MRLISCEHGANQNCHLAVLALAASPILEFAAHRDARLYSGSYIDESKRLVPSANIRSGVMRLTMRYPSEANS
jgi:hypothetical protein